LLAPVRPFELLLVNGRPVIEHDELTTVDERAATEGSGAAATKPGSARAEARRPDAPT
jgi:hypothetical protein